MRGVVSTCAAPIMRPMVPPGPEARWNPRVPRRVRDRLGRARGRDLRGGGHRRSRRGERRVRAVRGGQRRDAAESPRARRARVVRVVRVARRRGILGDGFRGISGISGISGPDPKWTRETVRRASRASRDDRRVVRFVRFARRVRVAPKQTPVRLRRAGAVQTDGTRRIVVARLASWIDGRRRQGATSARLQRLDVDLALASIVDDVANGAVGKHSEKTFSAEKVDEARKRSTAFAAAARPRTRSSSSTGWASTSCSTTRCGRGGATAGTGGPWI